MRTRQYTRSDQLDLSLRRVLLAHGPTSIIPLATSSLRPRAGGPQSLSSSRSNPRLSQDPHAMLPPRAGALTATLKLRMP